MLIYYKHPETKKLMIAQVTHSENGLDIERHEKDLSSVHERAHGIVSRMQDDEIVVTGNTTIVGNGRFLDNLYTDITNIKSKHPEIFTPLNPDYKPGRKELEEKRRNDWTSYAGTLRKERAELIAGGISTEDLEVAEENWEKLEGEMSIMLREEYDSAVLKLKSYKEMGVIVEPTCMEKYGESIISSLETDLDDKEGVSAKP